MPEEKKELPNPTITISLKDAVALHEKALDGCGCDYTYYFIAELFGVHTWTVYDMCDEVKK